MVVKKAKLYYTEAEWDIIKKKLGKQGIHGFINRRITSVGKTYDSCPKCIGRATGRRIEMQHTFSGETLEIIQFICNQLDTDPSIIISKFILDPLLID